MICNWEWLRSAFEQVLYKRPTIKITRPVTLTGVASCNEWKMTGRKRTAMIEHSTRLIHFILLLWNSAGVFFRWDEFCLHCSKLIPGLPRRCRAVCRAAAGILRRRRWPLDGTQASCVPAGALPCRKWLARKLNSVCASRTHPSVALCANTTATQLKSTTSCQCWAAS